MCVGEISKCVFKITLLVIFLLEVSLPLLLEFLVFLKVHLREFTEVMMK